MKTQHYDIEGMSCASCSNRITKKLENLEGVTQISVNLLKNDMVISFDDRIKEKDIVDIIEKLGYKAYLKTEYSNNKKDFDIYILIITIILTALLMIGMFKWHFSLFEQILILIPILLLNYKIFVSGYRAIFNFYPNMDSLISIGVTASVIYSLFGEHLYIDSSAMIISFILLGKYLEKRAKNSATDTIKKLAKLSNDEVLVELQEKEIIKNIKDVEIGDVVIVKTGDKISCDGEIVEGLAYIDESSLTGESMPKTKTIKDLVYSGTINTNGYFKFKVTKKATDTLLSNIIRLIDEATSTKPKITKIVDKVSAFFIPVVLVISVVTFIIWYVISYDVSTSLMYAVSVLVISCPCALGLATPASIMVGTTRAYKMGIIFKNSESIEKISTAKFIAFDKTGTLTKGKPEITKVELEEKYKKILYSLELLSSHPLAKSIIEYLNYKDTFKVNSFNTIIGKGISGEIEGVIYYVGSYELINDLGLDSSVKDATVYLATDNKVLGYIYVEDVLRKESKRIIKELKELNLIPVMITGDNKTQALKIANKLNIDKVYYNVLPSEKYDIVSNLQKEGSVIMVGDGINDSVALVKADIGISLGSGTDIAMESSDIILLNDGLENIVNLIKLFKKIINNIKFNLFWAFIYNALGIPIASGLFVKYGLSLNPQLAALAMSFSSVCVLLNALRLRRG